MLCCSKEIYLNEGINMKTNPCSLIVLDMSYLQTICKYDIRGERRTNRPRLQQPLDDNIIPKH